MLAGTKIVPGKGVYLQPIVFIISDLLYYFLNNITPPKNSIIESVYLSAKTENDIRLGPGAEADYDDAKHRNTNLFWRKPCKYLGNINVTYNLNKLISF